MRRELLPLGVAFATLTAAPGAAAFCRTTTVPAAPDADPATCWTYGVVLYHPSQCLPYSLLARESPVVSNAVLSETLARAFAAWTAPNGTCTPGITAVELAPVGDATIVDYKTGQRGHNVFGVADTWKHAGGDTLALATLTYDATTGEVFDVDLEVNPGVAWATGATIPTDGYDLQSALTHEAGHVLGFGHVGATIGSVMTPTYTPGTTSLRELGVDDQQAICWAYPSRAQRMTQTGLVPATACNLASSTSSSSSCDPQITHGCAVVATPPGRGLGGAVASVLALASVLLLRARRRR